MKNNTFKKSVGVIFLLVFWLFVFELSSFYILKNWGDPLDKAYNVIRPDGVFGWRQKSNLNTTFISKKLTTDKDGFRNNTDKEAFKEKRYKVLTFGPSSAFGWGVSGDETYTYLLGKYIESKTSSVSTMNFSQIGFSSYQGEKLYKSIDIKKYNPELIIIAYGVNDIDKYRFFFSSDIDDKSEFSKIKSEREIRTLSAVQKSSFVKLILRATTTVSSYFSCSNLEVVPVKRMSSEDSINSISTIIESTQKLGGKVVLVNTPFVLNAYDINKDSSFKQINESAKILISQKKYNEAIKLLSESLVLNAHQTSAHYLLMSIYAQKKECFKANKHLRLARNNEPYRIKSDIFTFNRVLSNLSDKYKVGLVDAHRVLGEKEKHFVDPIHPSKSGHVLLAKEIYRVWEILNNE